MKQALMVCLGFELEWHPIFIFVISKKTSHKMLLVTQIGRRRCLN